MQAIGKCQTQPLYPRAKYARKPLNSKVGGSQILSGRLEACLEYSG